MIELMNKLNFAKEVLIKIRSINMVEVKAKPRNNGPNTNKKKKKAGPKRPSTKKDGKPKEKCFKCGEKGHLKKDYPKLNKQGLGHSFTIEVLFSL